MEVNKKYIYEGTWRNNLPEGKGNIIFGSGEYFEGEFESGEADGKGRYIFLNGDYYEGNIEENKANGVGKFVGKNFEFEGTWENSKPKIGKFINKETGTVINMTS
jgi:radial spoke head protein 1